MPLCLYLALAMVVLTISLLSSFHVHSIKRPPLPFFTPLSPLLSLFAPSIAHVYSITENTFFCPLFFVSLPLFPLATPPKSTILATHPCPVSLLVYYWPVVRILATAGWWLQLFLFGGGLGIPFWFCQLLTLFAVSLPVSSYVSLQGNNQGHCLSF